VGDAGRIRAAELVGAHVSTAGGYANAPQRCRAIGGTVMQIFTKTPNQWRERAVSPEEASEFRRAVRRAGLRGVLAHDSYLINLASPDPALRTRSIRAFTAELRRCTALGVDALVSHPGNYLDDRARGMARNAAAYGRCLRAVPGRVVVLLETTAGTGSSLGRSFEELAELRDRIDPAVRKRVAFCADTCHLYSAGYDLVGDFDGVWTLWDRIIGLRLLRCLHLNDSRTPLGSRRDRHALLGGGTLGREPFRRIMRDPRFAGIPKILETPKGDDEVRNDRRMVRLLRRLAGPG
jgi:deoxyribonuclease-4